MRNKDICDQNLAVLKGIFGSNAWGWISLLPLSRDKFTLWNSDSKCGRQEMCLKHTEKPDLMTHKILYSPRSLGSSFVSTATYCVICVQIHYKVAWNGNMGQIRGSDEFSLCDWFKAEAPSRQQGMENSLINSALWCEFTAEHPDTSLLQKCPRWCLYMLPTQQL